MITLAYDGTLKFDTKIDESGFNSGIGKLGSIASKGLKATGAILAGAATAVGAIGAAAIKVGSDFEAGMSKVQAISGASAGDMERLTAKAKEMGSKTKFSATESAEAFQYMAMAGWKTGDMLDGIEGIMNLAAASGEDLATTSDIVTDALTAFGLKASDSGRFADVLAAASSNANTNVSMLGESFKYVAPVAGALGYSAEDTAVALGLMANSGIKASQAGTSLRAIMTRLVKPTDDSAAAMDALGISVTDSNGNMKSLDEVMGDLRQAFSGLTEEEKASMAANLAGQEAMSGLLAIVNASDKDFAKLKDSIYNCDGAAEKMAETMQDNLQGQMTLLKSALEGLGISLYEHMQEPLKNIVKEANSMIGELQKAFDSGGLDALVSKAGDIFAQIVVKAAEAGPKLIEAAVSLVHSFCKSLKSNSEIGDAAASLIMTLVKGLLACAGDIWSTAIVLIGRLAAGLSDGAPELIKSASECFQNIMQSLVEWMPDIASAGVEIVCCLAKALIDNIPMLIDAVKSMVSDIMDAFAEHFPGIGDFLKGFVDGFTSVVGPALSGIVAAFQALFHVLSSLPPSTLEMLGKALGVVAAAIVGMKIKNEVVSSFTSFIGVATSFKDKIKDIPDGIGKVKDAFGKIPGIATKAAGAFTSLSGIASTVGGAISSIGGTIISGIGSVIATLGGPLTLGIAAAIAGIIALICNWDAVKEFFTKTVPEWFTGTVVPFFSGILDTIASVFTEKIPALISSIAGWFAELPGKIGEFFSNILTTVDEWIAGMAEKALELGAAFIDKVVGFFTELPGKIWEFLTAVIGSIGEWILSMGTKAMELGAAFIDKIVEFFTQLPYNVGYFLGTVIGTVAQWVMDMAAKALEFGTGFIEKIVEFFTQLPGKVWDFLVSVVSKVAEWIPQMVAKAAEAGINFLSKVVEFFSQLPQKIWEFLSNALSKAVEWTSQMLQKAVEAGTGFLGKVVEFFSQLPGKAWEFLSSVIEKAVQWVSEMVSRAAEAGASFLGKIVEFFSQLPGKAWEFLSGVFGKVTQWASGMVSKAAEMGVGFLGKVVEFFTQLPGRIWEFLSSVVDKVAGWAGNLWEKGTAAASSLVRAVVDGVKGLPGQMLEVGKNIIQGVWKGICNAKDAFVSNVKNFFGGIVDGVKSALGIGSPSRVMAKEVGRWIPPGVGVGVEDAMPGLERQMDAEMAGLAEKMQAVVALETGNITVRSQQTAQYKAQKDYPKSGDTYVEEKIEQTNNYHVPVLTPSEVNKANREAARKLLGGVT